MNVVEMTNVNKSFRASKVVSDLSFNMDKGEILGLVGPNGAGKTTTIRMLMDIIKPDSGEIKILGEAITDETKNKIGYLPEERGLYKKLNIMDSLTYLAALKNISKQVALSRAEVLLKRVNMYTHRGKKTDELSHGMGQLVQFVATVLHDPELVVFDEPFMALDPVNTQLLKELIHDLKKQGKTIILSTHMMNQVEELCDRVLMINKGQAVLYGDLAEVKSRYRNNSVFLTADLVPDGLPGVTDRKDDGTHVELFLDGYITPEELLKTLVERGIQVSKFEVSTPSLNDIFIQLVKGG